MHIKQVSARYNNINLFILCTTHNRVFTLSIGFFLYSEQSILLKFETQFVSIEIGCYLSLIFQWKNSMKFNKNKRWFIIICFNSVLKLGALLNYIIMIAFGVHLKTEYIQPMISIKFTEKFKSCFLSDIHQTVLY